MAAERAVLADQARLHGAIVAALEIDTTRTAHHMIFPAALDEAADHRPSARNAAAAAIRRHLATAAWPAFAADHNGSAAGLYPRTTTDLPRSGRIPSMH